ncbi:MAG TPA: cytochrome P450 [Steroidobacteraceae bacterium]
MQRRPNLFNLDCPDFVADPYPFYGELRRNDPVWQPAPGIYFFSRHRDVTDALECPQLGHDPARMFRWVHGNGALDREVFRNACLSMMVSNGKPHHQLRSLVARAYRRALHAIPLDTVIQLVVDELLDEAATGRELDVIAHLARPLPVRLICELLGVPREEQHRFLHAQVLADELFLLSRMSHKQVADEEERFAELKDFLTHLVRKKYEAPSHDMLSFIADEYFRIRSCTIDEVLANVVLLLRAGTETTHGLIGNGLLALLRNPDQLALVQSDVLHLERAIEELLRFDAPVQAVGRVALTDTSVGDTRLRAADYALLILGSANHDPAAFESPDRLNILRDNAKSLAFGGGAHFCLGHALAKTEAQIALGSLLRRFPTLRLSEDAPPVWERSLLVRRLRELRATP